METLEAIKTRRSIRKFAPDWIEDETIDNIVEMATWAPSGLNNQPWRFVIVRDKGVKDKLAQQTKYSRIIENAPVCIAVFLDNAESYDRVKDIQAIGACLQNMLLAIHAMGLGAVWLGEILKNRKEVEKLLGVPGSCELMAVVALGKPAQKKGKGKRKPIDQVVLSRK
ncbi:MAG TPA: nitroreductase family protein [Desulfobacterales bacterium]|nr:nitroreductase family protein [Desulfobacterales bacterium]